MSDDLTISDEEFIKLPAKKQMLILYRNVKGINEVKKRQNLLWTMVLGVWSAFIGFAIWTAQKFMH
jgi:hypothetical protein